MTLPIWEDVHSMLRTVPTNWNLSVSYGVLYTAEPAEHVREFLGALQAVIA